MWGLFKRQPADLVDIAAMWDRYVANGGGEIRRTIETLHPVDAARLVAELLDYGIGRSTSAAWDLVADIRRWQK